MATAILSSAVPGDYGPDIKLIDYYDRLFRRVRLIGCAKTTHHQYRINIGHLAKHLGREPTLADLNEDTILACLSGMLESGRRPATGNKFRSHICALWNFAAKRRHVETFPDIPKLRDYKRRPHAWTHAQVEHLVQTAYAGAWCSRFGGRGGIPENLWWTTILMFICNTGARVGAVLQIRMDDFDPATGRVLLRAETQKQRADQTLFARAETLELLRQVGAVKREFLLPWTHHRSLLYYRFNLLLKAAGLPTGRGNQFHKLRRCCATQLAIRLGRAVASSTLGHSSQEITDNSYIDDSQLPETRVCDQLPAISFVTHNTADDAPIAPLFDEFSLAIAGIWAGEKQRRWYLAGLRRALDGCRIATVGDLKPATIRAWLERLRREGMVERTVTDYEERLRRFVRWLVTDKGIGGQAIACLSGLSRKEGGNNA